MQHFEPVTIFGGVEGFKQTIKRDTNKLRLIQEHHIQMIYILDNKKYFSVCKNKAKSFINLAQFEEYIKNFRILVNGNKH